MAKNSENKRALPKIIAGFESIYGVRLINDYHAAVVRMVKQLRAKEDAGLHGWHTEGYLRACADFSAALDLLKKGKL